MTTSRRLAGLLAVLLGAACSKGTAPGASGGTSGTSGIGVPQEISALPTKSTSGNGQASALVSGVRASALRASALATDPGTDYAEAQTFKFVDEQALSQFSIFNTIFKALGETHYADPENVNQGPYGCMVTWSEDHGGTSNAKQLIPWVVDSKMTKDANGKDVNQVKVWMQMEHDGHQQLIKVELDIFEAPTQRADGSYSDYGVWTINAKFDENATGYFAASCERDANGLSVIMLHERDPKGGGGGPGGGPPQFEETKGILKRSEATGYGVISAPPECRGPNCPPDPANVTTAYAYNAEHVALQQGTEVVYKDRVSAVDVVHRYGLYDADDGDDVTKSHSFGFPIKYTDDAGLQHWGYYGAWQGRHQLGYDGMKPIPPGSTVTRADLPPNAPAQSFTVSDAFKGTLVKRTLVPGDIQGIKGIVVQTWVNKNFQLAYDGSQWRTCPSGSWVNLQEEVCSNGPGSSLGTPTVFTDFDSLVLNPNDMQQQVMINYVPANQQCTPGSPCGEAAVYVAGQFFHTYWTPSPGPQSQPTSNGTPFELQSGDHLWVNIGGPIYISYDGASFVKKTVLSQNQNSFMPNFDPAGDAPFTLDPSFEYYFNTPGVNYVVKAAGEGYDVKVELQSVANPLNASTFVPAGTIFRQQWDNSACSNTCGNQSTYGFDGDSMKLVYVCAGSQDQNANGKNPGDVVEYGQWGLIAYSASCENTHVQYNWDFPQGDQQGNWGSQQYLMKGDGSLVILDPPIRLASIQLPNHAGVVLTLSLQFDGNWVNGLPDIYNELMNNDFVVSEAIADKIVVIPAGTEVVDASDATKHYLFKPLQMNQYLPVISDPGDVDLAPAIGLDLSAVPTFVDGQLGPLPDVSLKYSEGKLVE